MLKRRAVRFLGILAASIVIATMAIVLVEMAGLSAVTRATRPEASALRDHGTHAPSCSANARTRATSPRHEPIRVSVVATAE